LGPPRTSGSAAARYRLPWSTLDRILTEAKELWSVPLFVISGGEPLLYRSQGKDLLDLVEKHHDSLFLMFTNGTLIDHTIAARLHRLGNLTPAISVEGLRQATDQRRGAGMFDRVLAAMAHLRCAGVPFGLSATITRANCDEILSDPFLDFFFTGQGAFYGFLFQYTPIGRSADINLVPTPQQAAAFFRRAWEVVARKHLFLLDFANHGPLVEGCISAGRDRGYFYIDWSGKVMPCVFAPYSAANIHDVYAQGGTLDDVWASPFFRTVRNWQREYGFGHQQLTAETNWLRPCPFRDHHPQFRQWIDKYQLEPEDAAARDALADPAYYQALVACSARHATTAQRLWETEYLNPE
jgi:MoaA/NifB/PqqE/SkfB family radical SAM enzyme